MSKKLYIKTFGCQMNVYDSARMGDVLAPHGYESSETPEGAAIAILNTCHIREKAAEKMYSDLGRLRLEKAAQAQQGKRMLIAVAGCVAQAEGEEIIARAPYVDMVVGPQSYHTLPDLIAETERTQKSVSQLDFTEQKNSTCCPKAFNRRVFRRLYRFRKAAINFVHSVWCPIRAVLNFRVHMTPSNAKCGCISSKVQSKSRCSART